jgi:hypothetical protein
VYGFDDAPTANRFMNDVNSHKNLEHAKAKLFDRDKVRIQYIAQQGHYDNTLSDLDSLCEQYGGSEVEP